MCEYGEQFVFQTEKKSKENSVTPHYIHKYGKKHKAMPVRNATLRK